MKIKTGRILRVKETIINDLISRIEFKMMNGNFIEAIYIMKKVKRLEEEHNV